MQFERKVSSDLGKEKGGGTNKCAPAKWVVEISSSNPIMSSGGMDRLSFQSFIF